MDGKNLKDNNIFSLPLDDFTNRKDVKLLYAPIAGVCTLATSKEIAELEDDLAHYPECESKELIENLISDDTSRVNDYKINTPDDFLFLYVLPTFKCNFSCSYCFSANGRATGEVKEEELIAALRFFIDKKRNPSPKLAITYLGGGEPTLSWNILKKGLEFASDVAKRQDITLFTTIVTNGSQLTAEMVETLRRHNCLVRVSFEILPDIQALQRGQYENVCRGLDLLAEGGVNHMVRSMITPDNVNRLVEMIETLRGRFPAVKSVLFDPITSSHTFHEKGFTRKFYDDYFKNFLLAQRRGEELGIEVGNATLRYLDTIVDRYCTGELCLTPQGTLTICHQVSSPREKGYDDFIFGRVENGEMIIDTEKFKELRSRFTVYDNPRCAQCEVKWTCGGGCTQRRRQYSDEILEEVCRCERRLTTTFLLQRMAKDAATDIATMIERYGAD